MKPKTQWRADTQLVHGGAPTLASPGAGPVNVPVVRTSTVRFDSVGTMAQYYQRRRDGERIAGYGRHGLDTHQALEEAVTQLEGGYRSWLTPSGLSAIALVFIALCQPGDHVLVADSVYSPVRQLDRTLLARYGVTLDYFSPQRDDLSALIRPNTRLLYLESPGSLLFEVTDFPAIAALAREHGVLVVADNTWSSGYFFQPLRHGAHITLQAATKYLAGHSDVMQGVVTVDGPELAARIGAAWDALGLTVGADDAYLTLRGIRTLGVRLRQHQSNALRIAAHLQQHPEVSRVFYPALPEDPGHPLWRRDFSGANGLLSFAFRRADAQFAADFVDALTLFAIGASWGGYESLALIAEPSRLAEHAAWRDAGATELPVVRLHVGLEDWRDLAQDIDTAFRLADGETP
ncbi:cystathionine beta-lyase [Brenneria tiliae]|uniref:cystathionine beta-lyase n=1 Tax=Brenneria tiliae TaxID=2914984 RepID=UPI002014D0B1|nr:cystathionine beta-lyase [Brenneria tiliae]MCL2899087.1 cystathionine beta-lyase [Brenneria tiliae]MCL2903465.1 cystathionine beta-lyase [Brenneria tiliae]